jgi:hypothetical protein
VGVTSTSYKQWLAQLHQLVIVAAVVHGELQVTALTKLRNLRNGVWLQTSAWSLTVLPQNRYYAVAIKVLQQPDNSDKAQ